ncbi:MAG TPA: acyl-CoA thioesterase II [Povalibacter sp.]|nr:acyl-CoA thioesterase II [Povalibacter sp.]
MSTPILPPPAPHYLHEVLELEQLDLNLFRSRVNQENINRSLFGGQILGQGLKAAALTVEPGRHAHSLHGYFLLAGASDIPVIYDVELTRDGGSFSTRRVVARQRAKTIFHMELSFHRQEQGFEHDSALEVDVPEPEQLLNTYELAEKYADLLPRGTAVEGWQKILELKPVKPEDFFLHKAKAARGQYWIRASSKLPDDPLTQMAAVAYLSDYFLLSTVLLRHPDSVLSSQIMMASLDHAMWFHRPCRADEWLLVDAVSPFAAGARGFTQGRIFDRNRQLVASVAQEGLVRKVAKK